MLNSRTPLKERVHRTLPLTPATPPNLSVLIGPVSSIRPFLDRQPMSALSIPRVRDWLNATACYYSFRCTSHARDQALKDPGPRADDVRALDRQYDLVVSLVSPQRQNGCLGQEAQATCQKYPVRSLLVPGVNKGDYAFRQSVPTSHAGIACHPRKNLVTLRAQEGQIK